MSSIPLSEKLRPSSFIDIVGQNHLLGKDGWIQQTICTKKPLSILLFGPPGSGKTTIAKIYAQSFPYPFVTLSAVFSGVADIKKIIQEAKKEPLLRQKVLLFVDEIHRFNKAQQDSFLPYLEDGTIVLIGATTENPSFVLNNALLSRLRVLSLNSLKNEDLEKILIRYEKNKKPLYLTDRAKKYLIELAQGDARHLLNMIENLEGIEKKTIDLSTLEKRIQRKSPLYDKHAEGHFNLISALHKSIRGSNPDAAIYWLCRMLIGGEDPKYLCRRLIRIASEDIGLADQNALQITLSAFKAFHMLGSPEGELAIAQATIYLALAPKSNATYLSFEKAKEVAKKTNHLSPPMCILNAPKSLIKDLGYGEGYIYDHDTKNGFSGQNYFPKNMEKEKFYHPKEKGFEREMKKRLDYFTKLKKILSEKEFK